MQREKKVLILTELGDVHAYAVAEALRCKGVSATLWHTADFPTRTGETIRFESGRKTVSVRGPAFELNEFRFDTVWHRRPSHVLDESRLHPADREFAELECGVFRRSLFHLMAPDAFWVNPPEAAARAGRKPVQHAVALEAGLSTPATLYTNDPQEIRSFIARCGGQIVYKPFRGYSWRDEETYYLPYTSLLTESQLVEDHLLQAVPGIYQQLVPKAFELRVTVIGNRAFAARLFSQDTVSGRLDWRKSYHELRMEPYRMTEELAGRCREVLRRLGLVFGCFDFIVTPDGDHVFLEVNEGGQFLFVERSTGQPLLDAFAEFLKQGSADFAWDPEEVGASYREILEPIRQLEKSLTGTHISPPDRAGWEGGGPGEPNRRRGAGV
jgi:glutathione synthase/RimK-type ligase-like ATP-grasp enzyme